MKRKKVFNLFQINLILLVSFAVLSIPIIIVFAYIVDLHLYLDEVNIILIAALITTIASISGTVYLILTKEKTERTVKASYTKEYSTLLVISSFGVLGIGILFIYLNGPLSSVPYIVIPLFIFTYTILFFAVEKYFNVNLLRK